VFIVASITDGPGWLSGRAGNRQITTLGMLLDPLADKLMVTAAYILLVAYNPRIGASVDCCDHHRPRVPGVRAALHRGVGGVHHRGVGRWQAEDGDPDCVVVAAILAHRWNYWNWGGFIVAVHMIALWAIYWMTIVSIISADGLLCRFWKEDRPRQRARAHARSSVLSRRKARRAQEERSSHIV